MDSVSIMALASALLLALVTSAQAYPRGSRLYDVLSTLQEQNERSEGADYPQNWDVGSFNEDPGQSSGIDEGLVLWGGGSPRSRTPKVVDPQTDLWNPVPDGARLVLKRQKLEAPHYHTVSASNFGFRYFSK